MITPNRPLTAASITLLQLIEAIRQVAAGEPDFVYDTADRTASCDYAPNALNRCGCIVGEALALLGVPRERLARLDMMAAGNGQINSWGTRPLAGVLADLVEPDALYSYWVILVQTAQDGGRSWAEAVAYADELVVAA